MAAELTLGSLVDGIAGFSLAVAGLGIKTVWTSEIEPNCIFQEQCERLQGFQDGWTEKRKDGRGISDNARYMALGNSIAVPCAVRVFRGIVAAEAEVAGNADNDNQ